MTETDQQKWIQKLTVSQGEREVLRFWQPGEGYDKNLWNKHPIANVIENIHTNAAERGRVA